MKHLKKWYVISLSILIVICIGSWIFVSYKLYILRQQHGFFRPSVRHLMQEHQQNIHPTSVNFIQSWMTFDYLNKIFQAPSATIEQALTISDKRYPYITIKQYATENHLSQADALQKVKDVFAPYVSSSK